MPRPLAAALPGHAVQTVVEAGWAGVQNSDLLRRALAAGFEVIVTMDRNLEHQQNIARSGLGLLVIIARDNRVETVLALAAPILTALGRARAGEVLHVGA